MKRPCVDCGTPTTETRCPNHQLKGRTHSERLRRQTTVQTHILEHGTTCPGYQTPPHQTTDLTADHIIPRSQGGEPGTLQVLCRSCNSRRGTRPA